MTPLKTPPRIRDFMNGMEGNGLRPPRLMSFDNLTAAVYVRQGEEELTPGIEDQIRGCRDFLNRKGLRLKRDLIFSDEGFSGSSLKRPGLARLREAVKAGAVSAVLVWKLDRLSTSLLDCVSLVRREWAGKCFLVSVSEDFHTGGPSGERIFGILENFLQAEGSALDAIEIINSARASRTKGP